MKRFFLGLLTFAFFNFSVAEYSSADVLVPCKDSKSYNKRATIQVKKLKARLKKYDPASPAYLAIEQRITRTENRFANYANSGLLCGTDGLPHLIADGRWSHSAEFILPGFGFIYISGWIGWVGRKYLRAVSTSANPSESEIIINVPLALKIMTTGYIWPISAWQELISNDLVAVSEEITVSPR